MLPRAVAYLLLHRYGCLAGLFVCLFTGLSYPVQGGELVVSGVYQGKNLFVQNPFSPDQQNYCTDEVYVNDIKKMSNIKHSAFEIDLSHLEMESPVTVRIVHKDGCTPKIINPQVLRPNSTFVFNNISVDENSIDWTATGETPKYTYYVEQFVNSNWLVIKKFEARGNGAGIYSFPLAHNTGTNKYRIRVQHTDTHQIFYSKVATYESAREPITFYPKSVTSKITLSREADYEVLDTKGHTLKRGKGKEIATNDLKMGVYYLNIDNRTEKFFKK